ncbi:LysM peptidoglycan-binding domain-containing protein [Nocardia cyriacigeorgica]|uniref:LysM peptidoglycan-binding domain-containing protein n=1 Tax=Nocardia cyriacigeorgica TaxID=135487 RepID=UPI00158C56B9|nr:LysM peptidoglycan-binding domain-containing protein [Nocardia cyriacigeorgica]
MGDTLRVGEQLGLGQALENGAYTLTLQEDGNLVLREPGNELWASGTHGQGVDRAILQEDGNFVLYKGETGVWSTKTHGNSVDRVTLQADRNFVVYGTDGVGLWSTRTHTDTPIVVDEAPAAPAVDEVPPPPPAPRTHTVEPGDTLWAVAERFYGDGNRFHEIAAASGLDNPDAINVGQVLTIP